MAKIDVLKGNNFLKSASVFMKICMLVKLNMLIPFAFHIDYLFLIILKITVSKSKIAKKKDISNSYSILGIFPIFSSKVHLTISFIFR